MAQTLDPISRVLADLAVNGARAASPSRNADEQEGLPAFLHGVRVFCASSVDPAASDRGRLAQVVLDGLGARGLFGLCVPLAFGGAGLSLGAAARVVTELALHDGSLAACVGLHSGLAINALLHRGSPALKERYLPDVAAGKRILAFAATEPSAGSDISAVRTTLAARDGTLRLDGSKCYVTNGGICGLLTVLARSPGLGGARAGHTLVLVDPAWPGVVRGAEEHKLGLRGSSTITIDLEGVEIPRDHVLGEASLGLSHAHEALAVGRSMLAAGCVGTARGALLTAERHVRERAQFGRPLARFPLVRRTLAEARASLHAVESTVRLACGLLGDGEDGAHDSLVAKVFASESAWSIVDASLQLLGGAGYIEDVGLARRLRDVRVTRIFEGSNEVLRLHLASASLSWALEESLVVTLAPAVPVELQAMARTFDDLRARTHRTLTEVRKRHGFRLFEKQCLQVPMADAVIALYAMLAVLARAAIEGEAGPRATTELSCAVLARRATRALEQLRAEEDPAMTDRVDAVLA